jgi:hypothetical protein
MEHCGGAWGAQRQVVLQATHSLVELFETVIEVTATGTLVTVATSFDEFSLDIEVRYSGRAMLQPGSTPTAAEMLENIDRVVELGPLLIKNLADRVKTTSIGDSEQIVHLHFHHSA